MESRKLYARLAWVALAGLCGGAGIGAALVDEKRCEFVTSLEKDYESRIEFSVAVKRANHPPDMETGIPYNDPANLVTVTGDDGTPVEIDRFSYACIQCHDGKQASAFRVQLRGAGLGSAKWPGINRDHPIGMDYGRLAANSRALRSVEGLTFIAGRVGCLSCHDPLNPAPPHLARSIEGSEFCMSCHIK